MAPIPRRTDSSEKQLTLIELFLNKVKPDEEQKSRFNSVLATIPQAKKSMLDY